MSEVEDFFGGGGPALKFPTVGTKHVLTITDEPEVAQQTDFDSGEPLWWDDEKTRPKNQMIIHGVVPEDARGDDEDDGERRLFVKSGLVKAIRDAMRTAKVKAPSEGGVLTVAYVKDGPKPARGYPPKVYEASYVPPAPGTGSKAASFLGSDRDEPDIPAAGKGPIAKQIEDDKRGRSRAKASVGASSDDSEPPPF